MKPDQGFKITSITFFWVFLALFAALPVLCSVIMSFLQPEQQALYGHHFSLQNYQTLLHPMYLKLLWRSLRLGLIVTVGCLFIGYPFAFIIAHTAKKHRAFLLMLVIIPFWTSTLLRTYAMTTLLQTNGLFNKALLSLGWIHQPLHLLYTNTAVVIGLIYNLLPFMILPLYANIEKLDNSLIEAAYDLGATRSKTFWTIIFPLTKPGIISGCILVLLPAMTLFYIPDILGGAKSLLLGNVIQLQFLEAHNWPLGSAISVVLTVFMGVLLCYYNRSLQSKKEVVL